MAGAGMNNIKARMKSVESTMQITCAMELVATSKLRRAKESVERTRPFHEALKRAISDIMRVGVLADSDYTRERSVEKTLFIVIAGDRGLAGGYNSNVLKLGESLCDTDAVWLPLGKKALEYYRHRDRDILSDSYEYVANIGVGDALAIGKRVTDDFLLGRYDRVVMVYTEFVSMMTVTPVYEELLPLKYEASESVDSPECDASPEEMLDKIVPEYIGGRIYSAVCESVASETSARRSAMNSANKNAKEMIESLTLMYNRARQAVITQEITEIVSGAEAL